MQNSYAEESTPNGTFASIQTGKGKVKQIQASWN